jgi:hypothetical protein
MIDRVTLSKERVNVSASMFDKLAAASVRWRTRCLFSGDRLFAAANPPCGGEVYLP